ncbi:MAG TPA: four helix bundle protein [Thermoanaerobaculia bacterium]|nr:four helix bundle protein [Thermoanaerobaculia bacterium]
MVPIQERSFEFACRIVILHEFLLRKRGTGRTLASQVLKSGTSVGANLEEASGGQTKADFISKCRIALKESRECRFWLRVLGKTGIVPAKRIDPLIQESNELVSILTAILKKATASSRRGVLQES